jgi:hypothetical protein
VGAQRPVGRGNEIKMTGARSARARTRGQNPLVFYISFYNTFIHISIPVHSCFLIALRSVEGFPGMQSRDSNSGLSYSKPTHYYLIYAAPKRLYPPVGDYEFRLWIQ